MMRGLEIGWDRVDDGSAGEDAKRFLGNERAAR